MTRQLCDCCDNVSVTELDGDMLCQSCADAWVRAEGRALMEADARHDAMMDGEEG